MAQYTVPTPAGAFRRGIAERRLGRRVSGGVAVATPPHGADVLPGRPRGALDALLHRRQRKRAGAALEGVMIPNHVIEYLEAHGIPYRRRPHARAVSGSELAQSLHTTGYRVAKTVIVSREGELVMAVLPVADRVDLGRLGEMLGAQVTFVSENDFTPAFAGCEPGAEPPFGKLYGMPVVLDDTLIDADRFIVRAGSHRESLEMSVRDYVELEQPRIGSFAVMPAWAEAASQREART